MNRSADYDPNASVCRIVECDRAIWSRTLCEKHYRRWRKHGDPEITGCHFDPSFHGMSDSPEYAVWKCMRQRCGNPRAAGYADYGGRGIKVCERWQKFEGFFEDMGKRPTSRHSVNRINNNGNYEPANCHWATAEEQQRNTRRNRLLVYQGITQCATAWAEQYGMDVRTLHARLKSEWSLERALTEPRTMGRRPKWKQSTNPS